MKKASNACLNLACQTDMLWKSAALKKEGIPRKNKNKREKEGMNRFRKSVTALILASLIALQGTEPIFVQAKEIIEDAQKNAEFSRPEALTEEEAGIKDSASGEQDQPIQSEENVPKETENGCLSEQSQ